MTRNKVGPKCWALGDSTWYFQKFTNAPATRVLRSLWLSIHFRGFPWHGSWVLSFSYQPSVKDSAKGLQAVQENTVHPSVCVCVYTCMCESCLCLRVCVRCGSLRVCAMQCEPSIANRLFSVELSLFVIDPSLACVCEVCIFVYVCACVCDCMRMSVFFCMYMSVIVSAYGCVKECVFHMCQYEYRTYKVCYYYQNVCIRGGSFALVGPRLLYPIYRHIILKFSWNFQR